MEPLQIDPTLNDRARLAAFVSWVHDLLAQLVLEARERPENSPFVPRLVEPMVAAWEEGSGEFGRVIQEVEWLSPEKMRAHGLHGAQLSFKIATVAHWSEAAFGAQVLLRRPGLLRTVIDAIDTLLNSVLGAIPGGSAASELKDSVRDSIADDLG